MQEKELNSQAAMQAYQKAADCFEAENSSA